MRLDTNDLEKAINVVSNINSNIIVKIGMEFFYAFGYSGIEKNKKYQKKLENIFRFKTS